MQGAEKSVFVRCRSCVRNAVIKAIWTFSKFSLILLWKGFGGVTHRQLLDPKFGRFTSKFVDFFIKSGTLKCILFDTPGGHIGFERLWASILLRVGISAYQPSWVVFASVGTISDRFWGVLLVEFSVLTQNK